MNVKVEVVYKRKKVERTAEFNTRAEAFHFIEINWPIEIMAVRVTPRK